MIRPRCRRGWCTTAQFITLDNDYKIRLLLPATPCHEQLGIVSRFNLERQPTPSVPRRNPSQCSQQTRHLKLGLALSRTASPFPNTIYIQTVILSATKLVSFAT
ncbi:hypothetical protein K443DRAFT_469918 [Laccaria amethystina LaAM-08-1]|uniref:Uncharacterized protein n=1 Tax=Laccaria amethystina LaAM-08-1 TaxID=1095629 RepID=A0A0C9XFE5_9AGAR|nr:hypothetical protein K443DRAFT_469918 [Laccaria amethystina LaAM-08-1]